MLGNRIPYLVCVPREGAIVTWEKGLAPIACVVREVHAERDASRARANAIRWDFFT
jgi:hypothetical protein